MEHLPHKKVGGVDIRFLQVKIRSNFRTCKVKCVRYV